MVTIVQDRNWSQWREEKNNSNTMCGSSQLKVSEEESDGGMDLQAGGDSQILGNKRSNDAADNAQVWMDRD